MNAPTPGDDGIDNFKYQPVNGDCCGAAWHVPLALGRAEALSRRLEVLAQPERVQLLAIIGSAANAMACVCDLQRDLDLDDDELGAHLAAMRAAGLIHAHRRGAWTYYSARTGCLMDLDVAFTAHRPAAAPALDLAAATT